MKDVNWRLDDYESQYWFTVLPKDSNDPYERLMSGNILAGIMNEEVIRRFGVLACFSDIYEWPRPFDPDFHSNTIAKRMTSYNRPTTSKPTLGIDVSVALTSYLRTATFSTRCRMSSMILAIKAFLAQARIQILEFGTFLRCKPFGNADRPFEIHFKRFPLGDLSGFYILPRSGDDERNPIMARLESVLFRPLRDWKRTMERFR